jgi:hypothetical protein
MIQVCAFVRNKLQNWELLAKSPGPGERVGIRGILML